MGNLFCYSIIVCCILIFSEDSEPLKLLNELNVNEYRFYKLSEHVRNCYIYVRACVLGYIYNETNSEYQHLNIV